MTMAFDRRSMLVALGAAGLPFPAFGVTPRSDPQWIRALLLALHPGLFRYQSPAEFDARHAAFERAWNATDRFEPRYLALSRLLASIRCGHSYVNPYNQSKAVIARLTGGRRLLPFRFRWIGGRMVVTGDPHRTGLRPGTQILSVDRVPTQRILAALMPLARADGGNDAKRIDLMEVRGEDEFEAFDLFHPLLFAVGPTVQLGLLHPDGRREMRRVATVDRAARLAARPADPPKGDSAPIWTFERRGPAALMTMPGWALYDSKWDWKGWIDQRFAEMASSGTRGLVVDIRANEGGLDCGDEIIAHLVDRPLPPQSSRRLVRFRSVPTDLRPPLDTWDKSFMELGKDARPAPGGFFRLPDADSGGSNAIAPRAPRFRGKVAVLTSATNSSATFGFAERIKQARLTTLVGAPTGGNRRGINGGAFFFARLPGSGIEFDLPLIGIFPDVPQPDAGILPDVAVPVTARAIAQGRDEALERALRIVA